MLSLAFLCVFDLTRVSLFRWLADEVDDFASSAASVPNEQFCCGGGWCCGRSCGANDDCWSSSDWQLALNRFDANIEVKLKFELELFGRLLPSVSHRSLFPFATSLSVESVPHRPRICSVSAHFSSCGKPACDTFTWPLYMKSTSACISHSLISFGNIIIGCLHGFSLNKLSK